jgi:hypothetical protein
MDATSFDEGRMLAKRMFYVSCSILALTIAYQLGVTAAHGQASGTLQDADDPGLGSYVVTSSGTVYFALYGSNLAVAPRWSLKGTIPTSAPVVRIQGAGTTASGIDVVHAFDANGDFFVSADAGRTWVRRGNVFGGPTPGLRETWGQLKSRYAPDPGTAQPQTSDR